MTGMLTPAEFARKIGGCYATVIGWTLTGDLPFKIQPNKRKLIPEFEAMQSRVVRNWITKHPMKLQESGVPPPRTVEAQTHIGIEPVVSEEKLFLLARRSAEPFIDRARECRRQGKCQAEAELLWMAIERFGYPIE